MWFVEVNVCVYTLRSIEKNMDFEFTSYAFDEYLSEE